MIRLAFRHLRDTTNIGDRWCSPFDHMNWTGDPRVIATAGDLRTQTTDYDIGIFGGGKIMRDIARAPGFHLGGGRVNIGWGLSTVQRNPFSLVYRAARRKLDLIGSRDWDGAGGCGGADWVPCASSEHPFFNEPPQPIHPVVFYAHGSKTARMGIELDPGIPSRTNHDGTLVDALAFLASGETVVSNSYHGVFWALLLGRRVLCLPFSNKFNHFRLPPGFSSGRAWQAALSSARAQPELLGLCRIATARFRAKVDAEIVAALSRRGG